jgi:hypothetical protein
MSLFVTLVVFRSIRKRFAMLSILWKALRLLRTNPNPRCCSQVQTTTEAARYRIRPNTSISAPFHEYCTNTLDLRVLVAEKRKVNKKGLHQISVFKFNHDESPRPLPGKVFTPSTPSPNTKRC